MIAVSPGFSTLLDIDKLTPDVINGLVGFSFSTLLDIDKLTLYYNYASKHVVLVLCWILINLHKHLISYLLLHVLVLCWILINLHFFIIVYCTIIVLVLCWILINLHLMLLILSFLFVLVLCWILINLHSRSTESAAGRF